MDDIDKSDFGFLACDIRVMVDVSVGSLLR